MSTALDEVQLYLQSLHGELSTPKTFEKKKQQKNNSLSDSEAFLKVLFDNALVCTWLNFEHEPVYDTILHFFHTQISLAKHILLIGLVNDWVMIDKF